MILTKEQILNKIDDLNIDLITVFEGKKTSNLSDLPRFTFINEESKDKLKEFVSNLYDEYAGQPFTLLMRPHNDRKSSPFVFHIKTPFNVDKNPMLLDELVEKGIKEALEKNSLVQKISDLEAENEKNNSQEGKLISIATQLFNAWTNKGAAPVEAATQMQGLEPSQPDDLENALGLICASLGEETIIKFARKIQSGKFGESQKAILLTFINA